MIIFYMKYENKVNVVSWWLVIGNGFDLKSKFKDYSSNKNDML